MKSLLLAAVAACSLSSASAAAGAAPGEAKAAAPAAAKPPLQALVQLYFQPLDPGSWHRFLLADLVVRRSGGKISVEVVPALERAPDGSWMSPRGKAEVDEDRRIAFIQMTQPGRLWAYLGARAIDPTAAGWIEAARYAGLSPQDIDDKLKAGEGERALAEVVARAAQAGAREAGLYVKGRRFEKEQDMLGLVEAVNAGLPAAQRIELGKAAPELTARLVPRIWVVSDPATIVGKEDAQLTLGLQRMFPAARPQVINIGSPEADRFKGAADFVPAYLIEDNEGARSALEQAMASGFVASKNGFLVVSPKGRNGAFTARPEAPDQLDLFVMAQCPFGVQAVNALNEARKKGQLPAGLKLRLHHIVDPIAAPQGQDFKSLHGPAELQEDLRQQVIQDLWPDKLWDYLAACNKNVQSPDWQSSAKSVGIDPAAVQGGLDRAKTLLAGDVRLCEELGVGSSPTFLYKGRLVSVGLNGLKNFPGFEKVEIKNAAAGSCSN